MQQPKVSVIIITYNREKLLRETITAVLNQNFADFQITVVDDGSTDDTQAMVEEFKDPMIEYHYLKHTGFISKLRNYGIDQSIGEFITFLDSDDLWDENHLRAQIRTLDQNQEAGLVFNDAQVFEGNKILYPSIYEGIEESHLSGNILSKVLAGDILLVPSTLMFRRKCIDKVGLLNTDFKAGEYEFFTRLLFHFQASFCPSPQVKIRRHQDNYSAKLEIENNDEAIYCVEKYYPLGVIEDDIYRKLLLQYHHKLGIAYWRQTRHLQAFKEFLLCYKIKPVLLRTLMRNIQSLIKVKSQTASR